MLKVKSISFFISHFHKMSSAKSYLRYLKRFLFSLIGKDHFIHPDCDLDYSIKNDEYGAWPIIHNFFKIPPKVYSFGVGDNISWDLNVIWQYKSIVYAYDPTPRSVEWIEKQNLPDEFKFIKIGISNHNGEEFFSFPKDDRHVSFKKNIQSEYKSTSFQVSTLDVLMKKNGHQSIDLLKLDIEGFEYNVIEDIISKSIFPSILLVEFHHRFGEFGLDQTRNAINKLKSSGYSVFYVSDNGEEFGFVKKDLL